MNNRLELWHDLREKRLWPVALALLIAMVAIPVVLSKPSEEPPAAPPPKASTAPAPREFKGLASVTLEEPELGVGSTLNTFDPSDPFRPPPKVVRRTADPDGVSAAGPGPSSAADTGTPSRDAGTSGGDGGGGQTTDDGDTSGGDDTDSQPQTQQYAYVVDLTFTANGRTRRIKGVKRLGMLPNQANPLLLFLGVTPNAGNAVFLVDATLQAAGEGQCRPSGDECAFLYIGAGSVHEFTNEDGDSYRLRIDEIRKVKVGGSTASASKRKARTAAAALGGPGAGRRFAAPILADLVTVSNGEGDDSNSDRNNR